jgi:extracellular elastinolytic metalloproteinase
MNNIPMSKILLPLLVLNLILFGNIQAQNAFELKAKSYMLANSEALGLERETIESLILTDAYPTQHNGAYHLYYLQSHQEIPVFNAALNVVVTKNDDVLVTGNRLVDIKKYSWARSVPSIDPADAIVQAVNHINPAIERNIPIVLIESDEKNKLLFEASSISASSIPVELMYFPDNDGNMALCWNLSIDVLQTPDHWNYNIDANSGAVLFRHNYTSYCSFNINSFNHKHNHVHNQYCTDHKATPISGSNNRNADASYKVFPFPGESPNHIDQAIVNDPAEPDASPFGWHDTDGIEGHEYTITRGNNVHAYLDEFDNDTPSAPEPDGGDNLQFIFDFDPDAEADNLKDAAVVNLFYVNNRFHDLLYRFGFDENSGNFQDNNYGKGGLGGDYVHAQAFDGGGQNNANFSTPADGGTGRMQMYTWSAGENLRLEINSPIEIGGIFETGKASFGPDMDTNVRQGKVVIAQDDSNKPNLGCSDMVNSADLNGNIALIDRGICEFGSKVLNAEDAGAIAVLICNVEGVNGGTGEEVLEMGPGDEGDEVSIPSLFVKKSTCDLIKVAIQNNSEVNVTMGLQQIPGPDRRAGSFDNGVVIHEYTHGLSNRLTGGPDNSSCLYNADVNGDGSADGEQMGEGWSDFYALAFTTEPGDQGSDARGIGTYATGQKVTGGGIRHYPYSTDINISPVTYDFIKTTNVPHGVGEVFAAALWDLYWEMIEIYDFDPEWKDEESGNYRAMLLITDAMKMQACNPGFLDGRDAIIDADFVNFQGEHECLIWEVFARRGMGYYAEQGDPFDHRDGIENFDAKPQCIAELKISDKTVTMVEPGESISIQATAINHKTELLTGVKLEETLPDGLSYVAGSASVPATVENGILILEIDTLNSGEEKNISYDLKTDAGIFSKQNFYDDMEEDDGNWFGLNNVGFDTFWEWDEQQSNSGSGSWYVEESPAESDLSLIMLYEPIVIAGDAPALSFYHSFNTEVLNDGGFVEYSLDEGTTWNQFSAEDFIMNGYTGPLSYSTISIPGLEAFYGNSNGFIKSYIDLSFLSGQEVIFSFRYGTNDNTIANALNPGWFIDDVEVVDLKKYTRNLCIESAEGDNSCTLTEILIDSNTDCCLKCRPD